MSWSTSTCHYYLTFYLLVRLQLTDPGQCRYERGQTASVGLSQSVRDTPSCTVEQRAYKEITNRKRRSNNG